MRKFMFVIFVALLLACGNGGLKPDLSTDSDGNDSDTICDMSIIAPDLPVPPDLPVLEDITLYSGSYDDCKDLPEVDNGSLILGKGCFYGCIFAQKNLEITGAGSGETVIICNDKSKNGVIEISQNSTVTIKNLSIRGRTRGVFMQPESSLKMDSCVISDVVRGGINVCNADAVCNSSVTVENSIITGIIPTENGVSYGISTGPGYLSIRNSRLSGFNSFAVALWGTSFSKVKSEIDNAVISDCYGGSTDFEGTALYAEGMAEISLKKILVENVSVSFLYVSAENQANSSIVDIEDISARNMTVGTKQQGGFVFEGNIKTEIERAEITESGGYGIFLKGGEITGEDIMIDSIFPDSESENGFGMAIFDRSSANFSRLNIKNAVKAGILADGNCKIKLNNFEIYDTQADSYGEFGTGIAVQEDAEIIMKNGIVDNNIESGIMVYNAGIEISEVSISNTKQRKCVISNSCSFAPGVPFGHGISLYLGAAMYFNNISIINNRNGINMENSLIFAESDSGTKFVGNKSAVNAWNINNFEILEKALWNSGFCGNETIFTTDIQPVREGM